MISSSLHSSFHGSSLQLPLTNQYPKKFQSTIFISQIKSQKNLVSNYVNNPPTAKLTQQEMQKYCVPLAISLVLCWSNPAEAGFLSGSTGIESIPGPELPKVEFLDRFNEENQKKYAENDERIKSSPIIKELLERSKKNKEKNKQEILDKYCLRGAEWGVGDCSTEGMTAEERDTFIETLKQKIGTK
ncbi:uncharacterized protein LOC110696438 [Chenopodium quinoa]|uniref:Uncharacterized protein n=1 Tax=Chenopodium quinoa TaxID=63459 RepID=A0A803KVS8_CHEQI|nr:uncharacterized protein LOC110696438 [Chenopodium quinoa]